MLADELIVLIGHQNRELEEIVSHFNQPIQIIKLQRLKKDPISFRSAYNGMCICCHFAQVTSDILINSDYPIRYVA